MHKYSYILMYLFFVLLGSHGKSQPDTTKLRLLEEKARAVYSQNLDSSLLYAQQILQTKDSKQVPWAYGFALNWAGICYMLKGEPDSADFYYEQAILYGIKNDEKDCVLKARLNRGINYFQQGLFEDALKASYESLQAFAKENDSLGIAHAEYNVGNCLFQLGRIDEAKLHYKSALPIYIKNNSVLSISNTYNALGSVYQQYRMYDSALHYFRKSVSNKIQVGGENFCASEYINMGNTFDKLGKIDSAVSYLHKGQQTAEIRGDLQKVATAYLDLATIYNNVSKTDSALLYSQKAQQKAHEIGDNYLVKESLYSQAIANAKQNNYVEAYRQLAEYLILHDSITGEEVEKKAVSLEKRYQLEKKDKQILQQKLAYQEKEAALHQQILVSILLFLILIFGIFLFLFHRRKQQLTYLKKIDAERRRIAMDLHDHVGAELTLVSSGLDLRLYKLKSDSIKHELQKIANQVRKVNEVLRETVWSIREEAITIDQLINKLQDFASKFNENRLVTVSISSNTNSTILPPQIALTTYRILQEGITNVFKYANASQLHIEAQLKGKILKLSLSDNGTGFNTNQPAKGYGLVNMRQRAKQIKANLSIQSTPDKGTTITIIITLDQYT